MALISAHKAEQMGLGELTEASVLDDPAKQFAAWYQNAVDAKIVFPEAVNLATAELPSGRVSNRMTLMKELDDGGNVVIYSNWEHSRKAADVRTNQWVSLCFYWKELERQVRVEGKGTRLTAEQSQPYFDSRPRGARIGAWASHQSQPVASREELDAQVAAQEKRFEGQETFPIPPYWGGISIEPVRWEFWQGRRSRVHDRIVFERDETAEGAERKWTKSRISP